MSCIFLETTLLSTINGNISAKELNKAPFKYWNGFDWYEVYLEKVEPPEEAVKVSVNIKKDIYETTKFISENKTVIVSKESLLPILSGIDCVEVKCDKLKASKHLYNYSIVYELKSLVNSEDEYSNIYSCFSKVKSVEDIKVKKEQNFYIIKKSGKQLDYVLLNDVLVVNN